MRLEVRVPKGYTRVDEPRALIIARDDVVGGIVAAYRGAPPDSPTLHGYARQVPAARAMKGREIAYAFSLPVDDRAVVVRHNRHGGALRALTGDLFLVGETRAPLELDIALRLESLHIPTPPVLAYAVYPAGGGFSRSDVVTEEIMESIDLGALLIATSPDSPERLLGWNATRRMLRRIASVGLRHHDLNVKNVLLHRAPDDLFAPYLLDVDRVEFGIPRRDAYATNRARLRRSVEKWRDLKGALITDAEIDALRRTVPSIP